MKLAFLFPGQGAGMEREAEAWCARSEAVRRLVEGAAGRAGVPASQVFASRGVMPTALLEPVHTAICLGIHDELARRECRPDIAAGHSLGEIAACSAAGACSAEEAVALAAERGRLMAREAAKRPGGMVRFAGPREKAEEAVAFAQSYGVVAIAGHNTPDQWVLSGEWAALRRIATRYSAAPITVGGAWHSAVLAGAVEEFRTAVRQSLRQPLRIPFVSNRTGAIVGSVEELPDLLAEQFTHPILWARTMETLAAYGATDWITIGPGRVLRGLARLNLGDRGVVHSTETMDDLERCLGALAP